jgi:hypothetical protein
VIRGWSCPIVQLVKLQFNGEKNERTRCCGRICMLLGAASLLSTAGNTPFECFTTMGSYEDHLDCEEGGCHAGRVSIEMTFVD